MSMNAEIIAIGPFSDELVPSLPLNKIAYEGTKNGATIVVSPFGQMASVSSSHALASCFGLSDPWDFARHQLDVTKVELVQLSEVVGAEKANFFDLLRKSQFAFYFMPNG